MAASLAPTVDRSDLHRLQQAHRQQQQGEWLNAAATYAALHGRQPSDHRLLANQGNALWLADLPQAAQRCYSQALTLRPDCAISRRGLAQCLRDLNQFADALAMHAQLAEELPLDGRDGQANLWAHSQVLLGLQQYREAFALMAAHRALVLSPSPGPPGAPAAAPLQQHVRLVSDQGFGDTLQYVRFVIALLRCRRDAGLQGGVQLIVEPALVTLLREGLDWLEDPPSVHAKGANGAVPTNGLSLLALPHALRLDCPDAASPDSAYLRSPLWTRPQVDATARRLGVGLVSAAGRKLDDPFCAREYHKRTLPESVLWLLVEGLRERGATLVDLQFGPDRERNRALGLNLLDPGIELSGFATSARVLAQLDLVITVDTAMAHLGGAMAHPTWVLLPWSADPRWLVTTSISPWYANLRLFRQPRSGDWLPAVDQLLDAFNDRHHRYGRG